MSLGYLCLILHAHLPFVRHPEHDEFLEEDWLYEGVTETYVPLLDVFERLNQEGVNFRITMSITPPLCEMLADPFLQQRCLRYIEKRVALTQEEVAHTPLDSPYREAICMYESRFKHIRQVFAERHGCNLVHAFRQLKEAGKLEIITCAATHGMLPLMMTPNAVRAQLAIARANYEKHFGDSPRGIWLPECAYRPGLEEFVAEQGIQYFILDTHGLLNGRPSPRLGVFAPVLCPNGVAVFGRDIECSKQVWSARDGYPGDPDYREFYRDLGYDADYERIRPYLHADGVRRNLGIKYHRITGDVDLSFKEPYSPSAAREKAALHAGHFMFNRQHQIRFLHAHLGRKPIIVAPYDAELFGHWWYEGPDFLEFLIRKIAFDQDEISLATSGDYLDEFPVNQVVQPAMSSWGDKGYFEVWVSGANNWIYRYLHKAEEQMIEIARLLDNPDPLTKRAANQAARELLLAQSSDWAFIMTTGTMVAYAEKRTKEHLLRFFSLYDQIKSGNIDEGALRDMEWKDSIFQEIDYTVYR